MNEQKEFLSPNYKRLLSISVWARYLAWVVLVTYILLVITKVAGLIIEHQRFVDLVDSLSSSGFVETVKGGWLYRVNLILELLNILLRGTTYFILLMGLSFGLNSIIESATE